MNTKRIYLLLIALSSILLLSIPSVAAASELVVTLDANGGIFPKEGFREESTTREVVFNNPGTDSMSFVNVGITPARDGMHMLGWNTDKNASYELYDYQTFKDTNTYSKYFPMDGSVKTLYAIWTKAYNITLDANGGDFGTKTDRYGKKTQITTMTVEFWNNKYGNKSYKYSFKPAPQKNGYIHKGWSANKSAQKPDYSTGFDGLTLNSSTPALLYAIYGLEGDKTSDYSETESKTASTSDTKSNTTSNGSQTTSKLATKLTAKAKSFKAATKTKKYVATLKDAKGKAVTNVKLTLKVNKKTYTATTNSKGKATFKIKNLTKKGKYNATIKFAGNKSYKAVSRKVKITVK